MTYFGQAETMARQPPPEATSSDWCSYLTYDPIMGITNFVFPYDTLDITSGRIAYDGGGAYAALLSTHRRGAPSTSRRACLTRFGAVPRPVRRRLTRTTPSATRSLTDDLTRVFDQAWARRSRTSSCADNGHDQAAPAPTTIAFEPSGGGLSEAAGARSTTVMTHFAGTKPLIPSQADYCVSGDTMTLWGHDRAAIWDQPGLRTVILNFFFF